MSKFEFFMGFYGILLGIGLAELLLGFGKLIRARTRPKIGLLTPAAGVLVFLQLTASMIDAWLRLQNLRIDLIDLAIPIIIGVAYFLAAVTVTPDDHAAWPDLDDYFFARRNWILGPVIGVFFLTLAIEIPSTLHMIEQSQWEKLTHYIGLNSAGLITFLVAWRSKRPKIVLAGIIGWIVTLIFIYSIYLRVLGLS
ncbi:MAG: hypothetical protein LCH78_13505 [Proteobacteria bacterium]|nr:hypothetical protein [Pseudomonadota bacterium]